MAILAGDIKKGVCLRLDDGKIYVVIDFLHVKPGKGNTVMRTKLRNVEDGRVLERTWIVSAKLDDVQVSHQQFQYLYKEGETMVMASIDESTGTILTAEAPVKVILTVTYTEPGFAGNTATNATKPATLETGVEIRVPLFINEGDQIEVDTYVTRK